jgi:hypothetical protein
MTCEQLSELAFESGGRLATLGDSAFADCASLHSMRIPARLWRMDGSALAGCGIDIIVAELILLLRIPIVVYSKSVAISWQILATLALFGFWDMRSR